MSGDYPVFVLPDELIRQLDTYADAIEIVEWRLYAGIADFIDELPHGFVMQGYELVASHLRKRGRDVTPRTVRSWCDAYRRFTPEMLEMYGHLPRSILVLCVSLAADTGNDAGDLLEWASANLATADQLRAHWLPVTSDGYSVDDPVVSGIIRGVYRRIGEADPRRAVFDCQILPLLRKLFSNEKSPGLE